MQPATVEPTVPEETEPETLGDLIETVVGKALVEARKAWAKDLADLLDIGADSSDNDDPDNPVIAPVPVTDPVPAPTGIRSRKFSLL